MAGMIAESEFYIVEWLCTKNFLTLPGQMRLVRAPVSTTVSCLNLQ